MRNLFVILALQTLVSMSNGYNTELIDKQIEDEIQKYNMLFKKDPIFERFYHSKKQTFESANECYIAFQERQKKIEAEIVRISVQYELVANKNKWDDNYLEYEEQKIKRQVISSSTKVGRPIETDRDIYYYLGYIHRYNIETTLEEAKRHRIDFEKTNSYLYKQLRLD